MCKTWTARVPGEADVLTVSTAAELEALMANDIGRMSRYAHRVAGSPVVFEIATA
jgi:hypothetical protein